MEVMVAAGLLGVVTVGVMQITRNMTKSEKTQAQQTEFSQIQNQIQSILRDEYSCEASLLGLSPTGAGTDVTQVKRKRSDGSVATVFQTGQVYGSSTSPIFLKKMAIKNYDIATGIGEFYIEMNKGRKSYDSMTQPEKDVVLATSYGTAVVGRSIKMNLVLDGAGKVKDCVSDKDDYTSGACGMLDGDWTDKVKCKSINILGNGVEPSITAETNMHVKSGLNVGSTLSGDPGDGNVTLKNNLDVQNNATIKTDATITNGKLIFNTGDARINQVAGNNLYIENKAGTAGANIIAGKSGAARTTITPTSVTINKNGTIGAGLALEVMGNTNITGSGTTSVTLKVGVADIQYNGTNLLLNKPTGGVVQYKDGSTIEEVASQGWVNAQLGRALTGDSATLTTLLSNLSSLVSGSPIQAISASVCGFYSNMTWNGTRCVDNTTSDCGSGKRVQGWNSGTVNCQPIVYPNQTCPTGQIYSGHDSNGTKICANADSQIGNYVDSKIDAALKPINAKTTCAAFGGTPNGAFTQCNFSQGCTYSRTDDVGCHACPNTGAPSCNSCNGGSYTGLGSCGTWGTACQVGCAYTGCTGSKSCTCNLSTDGKSCSGTSCGSCS